MITNQYLGSEFTITTKVGRIFFTPHVYLLELKLKIMKKEKIPKATVSGSYAYGWQQMWKHFLYLFLITVVVALARTPVSLIQEYDSVSTAGMVVLQILAAAFMLLFIPVISYGSNLLYLRGMRSIIAGRTH